MTTPNDNQSINKEMNKSNSMNDTIDKHPDAYLTENEFIEKYSKFIVYQ